VAGNNTQTNPIELTDDHMEFNNFTITDPDIVAYFQNFNDSDLRKGFEAVLKMGITAMESVDTANKVDYIRKEFADLATKMDRQLKDTNMEIEGHIERAFGDNGEFTKLMREHFGEDGSIVKKVFDPYGDDTPLSRLRKNIEDGLDSIRATLSEHKGAQLEAEEGTKKGHEFEDVCETKLSNLAKTFADGLIRTGDKEGILAPSKKGDFVVTPSDAKSRKIVFEMKDTKDNSDNKIREYMNEAIKNRGADYGVYVVKYVEQVPSSIGWFNEYGNYLVCALETRADDNDTIDSSSIDTRLLEIAYKWARIKLSIMDAADAPTNSVDMQLIIKKIDAVKKHIEKLRNVKAHCTSINNATISIKGWVDKITCETNDELADISVMLNRN